MAWIRPAFIVIGLILVATGAVTWVRMKRRSRTWQAGRGEIVASRLDGDGHFRFQVAFSFDGQKVLFWNRFTTSSGVDPVGRAVDVLINPADPTDAVVVRGAAGPTVVGAVFVLVGVAAIAIGFLFPS